MTVITAPERLMKTVFLAGGITGCPDWQSDAIRIFDNYAPEFLLYNPRRTNFDVSDPTASEKQIAWEHRALMDSDAVLFWFPKNTLCPIVLFELGKIAAGTNKHISVGCEPGYQRNNDVIYQLEHIRPEVVVTDNLSGAVLGLIDQMYGRGKPSEGWSRLNLRKY